MNAWDLASILVVCHDAGPAALLSALIAHHRARYAWRFCSVPTAPAWAVATRHGLGKLLWNLDGIDDLEAELDRLHPDLLIHGTGWQRQLHHPLLAHTRTRGIPSLAVLDHWSGYRERFGYPDAGWRDNLPDYIAVTDARARVIAEDAGLPNLLNLRNDHYEDLLTEARACRDSLPQEDRLLVLSEPTARVAKAHFGRADHWGFTERDYVIGILEHFPAFGVSQLAVRLHPSDSPEVYETLLTRYPHIPCVIESPARLSLIASLTRSRLVMGLDSCALYVAYLLGLPAVSYLPGSTRQCHIPLPAHHCIRDLARLDWNGLDGPVNPASILDFGMEFPTLLGRIPLPRRRQ